MNEWCALMHIPVKNLESINKYTYSFDMNVYMQTYMCIFCLYVYISLQIYSIYP
jgi:hypothetical protein